ncbi:hypothetical protein VSO92_12365 [Myroides pelagicus]|uniref:hypothetical protein n=1 Tax=Myroides pelagicus TaxID=270914 RepID=UPI002DB98538|nr:hypothetical protein [Myroides pelagicus]MEC4114896.1 hypothetical protein [Myroides pelagicus]
MTKLVKHKKRIGGFLMLAFLFISAAMDYAHAQDKKNEVKIKNTTYQYTITKETKDTDLELIKKEVNNEKIANLVFSNIKRNDKGEIISITTKFKDKRGYSQSKSEYNSSGISPYAVKIHEKEDGVKYLEISAPGNDLFDANSSSFNIQSSMFNNTDEDFFSSDIMQMMRAMKEDMLLQQEHMKQMFQQEEAKQTVPAKTNNDSTQTK